MNSNVTRIIVVSLALLFAAPAFASTDGAEDAAHHGPKRKRVKVVKTRKIVKTRRGRKVVVKKVHPRRVRRRRVVRVRPPRRVVRRTVVRRTPVVHTTSTVAAPARSGAVRADNPLALTFAQKGVNFTGAELSLNIGPYIAIEGGLGVSTTPIEVAGCRGPGCEKDVHPMWTAGIKGFLLPTNFAPYVHLGVMGSMMDAERTTGLVGAGVSYQSRGGFTAGLGIDYAMGKETAEEAIVPTLNVGFAF